MSPETAAACDSLLACGSCLCLAAGATHNWVLSLLVTHSRLGTAVDEMTLQFDEALYRSQMTARTPLTIASPPAHL